MKLLDCESRNQSINIFNQTLKDQNNSLLLRKKKALHPKKDYIGTKSLFIEGSKELLISLMQLIKLFL